MEDSFLTGKRAGWFPDDSGTLGLSCFASNPMLQLIWQVVLVCELGALWFTIWLLILGLPVRLLPNPWQQDSLLLTFASVSASVLLSPRPEHSNSIQNELMCEWMLDSDISNIAAPHHHQESQGWAVTASWQLKASLGSVWSCLPPTPHFPQCSLGAARKIETTYPLAPEVAFPPDQCVSCWAICREEGRFWFQTAWWMSYRSPDSDVAIFVSAKLIIGFEPLG